MGHSRRHVTLCSTLRIVAPVVAGLAIGACSSSSSAPRATTVQSTTASTAAGSAGTPTSSSPASTASSTSPPSYALADRGNQAATNSLTNALTVALAASTDSSGNQNFVGTGPLVAKVAAAAPEFAWTSATCPSSAPNCASVRVYDVAAAGDSQGLLIAVPSSSGSCWYAIVNNATGTHGVIPFTDPSAQNGGSYYATGPQQAGSCAATDPQATWKWASSYSAISGPQ